MTFYRVALSLFLILVGLSTSANESLRVHPLYLEEAPRGDYVPSVVRDHDGFLWLATDNGLKRYNGYTFKVFTHREGDDTSLATSDVYTMLVQKNGTLWAGGSTLNRYHPDTESFTSYTFNQYKQIHALSEHDDHTIWVGGNGFGLVLFDTKSGEIKHQFLVEDSPTQSVFDIEQGKAPDILWINSGESLFRFNSHSYEFEHIRLPPDIFDATGKIRDTTVDQYGQVWLATNKGLYVFDPELREFRHYRADTQSNFSLSTDSLLSIYADEKDNIWIGTEKRGVHRYMPEVDGFAHYDASSTEAYRFPETAIQSITSDRKGSIWFSAGEHGVYRMSPELQNFRSFHHSLDSANSLSMNNILDMHEDREGRIWIATDGRGVNVFNPRTYEFTHYRHEPGNPNSLSDDSAMTIAETSDGYIWIGTWEGGLNRLDPESGNVMRIMRNPRAKNGQTLASNSVMRLHVDSEDRLIMAVGDLGIQIYDTRNGHFTHYSPLDGASEIRSDLVQDILPAPEGRFWIAGFKGLELFDPQAGAFYHPDNNIMEPIADLHRDRDGVIWVASNRGLYRFNPVTEEVWRFTTDDGLSDNIIVSIEQDARGYLWLATRSGLTRFHPIRKEVSTYDQRDGLAGTVFNRSSHLQTRTGVLYFGTKTGFSYFDPLHINPNEYAPNIHITDLKVNHKVIGPGEQPWLPKAINRMENIVLPSSADDIELQFTATNFVHPSKNQYQYRLLGQDSAWLSTGSDRRSVQLSNLPPGDYRFQVIASNNSGIWAGHAKELGITILPAWWQTWWAYTGYALLLLLVLHLFSYWRYRSNSLRAHELKKQVGEQTGKLKDANKAITRLNSELEQRVAQRTQELSLEVEERKESEAKVRYVAYHDSLTGLYNRSWLLDQVDELIKTAKQQNNQFALLFIGGDRFRRINEIYGHKTGDALLKACSQRLREATSDSIALVRLGSDEFVALVAQVQDPEQVAQLAESIIQNFKPVFTVDKIRIAFSVSVGFVIGNEYYDEATQVLRDANVAMQRAKDCGRGGYQRFDEEILQQTLEIAALEADLKQALRRQQFFLVYQPIVSVRSKAVVGFECLIRWRHPERGFVPPDRFIPLAESLGLIFDIGLWVLDQACQQLCAWQESSGGKSLPTLSVNLSPVQLERADFIDKVDEVLQRHGVSPANIKFEITESALMGHSECVDQILEALRERGIELAIDDFGTGYSSLSYLDRLPVQVLKIDRSFVDALTHADGENCSASEIVRATISLAHNLNMRVVAEGIETEAQLAMLLDYGCDFGQGYFIAKPLSREDATEFLAQRKWGNMIDLF